MADWLEESAWDGSESNDRTTSVDDDCVDKGKSFGAGRGYPPFDDNAERRTDDRYGGGDSNGFGRGGMMRHGPARPGGGASDRFKKYNDDCEERGDRDYESRRGRGGFRGGRGGGNFNNDNADTNVERPKVTYIPKDIDDNELFDDGITSGINFDNYENIEVVVTGENCPLPIQSFEDAKLHPTILDNICKSNYAKPTPIQKRAIPIILNKRDVMACAQTGSGKTAAFLLPIIHTLMCDAKDAEVTPDGCSHPLAVIVSPTRELAIQIHREALKFSQTSSQSARLKCCIAYGGTAPVHQGRFIQRGCHILVATSGRLLDFVARKTVDFAAVKFLVLDEADRMLDMGFMPDVEKIMQHSTMPPKAKKVTLMFSATFPTSIQELAGRFLENYLFIAVGIVGGACSDVEQIFYQVSKFEKKMKLQELLTKEGSKGVLVFVATKRNADFIAVFLSEAGFPTTSIHGDRLQREREEALEDFKSGKCGILVATSVAARGLDIKNVKHVINYDLPNEIDEYVHRIGRTGRVGNRGKATSFYDSNQDSSLVKPLVTILKQAGQPVPDFLSASSGAISCLPQETFGGEDIRSFNEVATADCDVAQDEEVWN